MKLLQRWLCAVLVLIAVTGFAAAETVASLPAPTGYVNDFAGVLRPDVRQSLEDLLAQVDQKAQAQIAVVTIKTLDNDQSIEEFATELEDKWKVGNKDDRGVLMIVVLNPRRGRIEVGYGLEGILNDARAGDILRSMTPAVRQGDFNTAIPLGARQIAAVIAQDAGVTLALPDSSYQSDRAPFEQAGTIFISPMKLIAGGFVLLLILFFLIRTGNTGILFFILGSLMGGGGRGYRDDDFGGGFGGGSSGGGFGCFGGGSSGGGGASIGW
ncbi:MAG: TPM domain-containing protein [Acidobacteriaceae bacterium]|nr:TPM domain-containing protein [Acidobacteriaceae bacterium]